MSVSQAGVTVNKKTSPNAPKRLGRLQVRADTFQISRRRAAARVRSYGGPTRRSAPTFVRFVGADLCICLGRYGSAALSASSSGSPGPSGRVTLPRRTAERQRAMAI